MSDIRARSLCSKVFVRNMALQAPLFIKPLLDIQHISVCTPVDRELLSRRMEIKALLLLLYAIYIKQQASHI